MNFEFTNAEIEALIKFADRGALAFLNEGTQIPQSELNAIKSATEKLRK